MIDFLLQVFWETWSIFKEASVFLLFGFALAGVIAVLIQARTLLRFLGRGKVKSVLWASALGIPLPLCSCGVVPTALGLRRQGATKGATVSFLVSTPETGVDSISLSYALMDPIITIFRPAVAMVTAVAAGLATNFFGEPRPPSGSDSGIEAEAPTSAPTAHAHHDRCDDHCDDLREDAPLPWSQPRQAVAAVYRYAFRELLDETSYWLFLGIVLSALVAVLLPPSFFAEYLSGEFSSMLVMLLIGIPIYTCASSSTPVAAAFVLKGLNPGAALVFLLAGPATNVGSLTVLLKFLGARVVAIYLGAIVIVTLAAGYTLNWVYQAWAIDPRASFGAATEIIPEPLKILSALILIGLLFVSMRRTHLPGEWLWLWDKFAALTGVAAIGRGLK